METELEIHRPAHRHARWLPAAILGLIALMFASATIAHAEGEVTEDNPNNYQCRGHIQAGKPEAGSEEQQVEYDFACDGPITGYQLESNLPITGFSSAPLVSDYKGEPLPDALSCSGEFPGWAVNCVGTTKSSYETISGQFAIGSKLCAEPRVDPILTVTYASGSGTYTKATNSVAVTVTQAIAGPFDLGRPHGCPASADSGGSRLDPKPAKASKGKLAKNRRKHKHNKKHPRVGK